MILAEISEFGAVESVRFTNAIMQEFSSQTWKQSRQRLIARGMLYLPAGYTVHRL